MTKQVIARFERKRNEHLAMAGRYQEIISFLQGDEDLTQIAHVKTSKMLKQAMQMHGNGNGHANGNGHHVEKKKAKPFNEKQSRRMKRAWKKNRTKWLANARQNAAKARAAKVEQQQATS